MPLKGSCDHLPEIKRVLKGEGRVIRRQPGLYLEELRWIRTRS